MELQFLNVGYGDALLIHTDTHAVGLLDAGSGLAREYEGHPRRRAVADYLRDTGCQHLDWMIFSHIHEDHICGLLPVFDQLSIETLYIGHDPDLFLKWPQSTRPDQWLAPFYDLDDSTHRYTQALAGLHQMVCKQVARGGKVRWLKQGDFVTLADQLNLHVWGPSAEGLLRVDTHLRALQQTGDFETARQHLKALDRLSNDSSLLLFLDCAGYGALMAADSVPRLWSDLGELPWGRVRLLKVPHHGQRDSVDPAYLDQMSLEHVILTSSSDLRNQTAQPEVLEALRQPRHGRPVNLWLVDPPETWPQAREAGQRLCFRIRPDNLTVGWQ